MRLKNQLFMNAFDWLVSQGKVKGQKDFAARIGVSENTITRIKDDANQVSDRTIRMMNKAFDNIFNIGYFKGEELFMLVEEKIYYTMHPEESPFYQPDKNPQESTSGENQRHSSYPFSPIYKKKKRRWPKKTKLSPHSANNLPPIAPLDTLQWSPITPVTTTKINAKCFPIYVAISSKTTINKGNPSILPQSRGSHKQNEGITAKTLESPLFIRTCARLRGLAVTGFIWISCRFPTAENARCFPPVYPWGNKTKEKPLCVCGNTLKITMKRKT